MMQFVVEVEYYEECVKFKAMIVREEGSDMHPISLHCPKNRSRIWACCWDLLATPLSIQ